LILVCIVYNKTLDFPLLSLGLPLQYFGNDPEKISCARLCVFQLIHVACHIEWNGSIRVGSQSTVERAIGSMGHQIQSKKAPFAHLAMLSITRFPRKTSQRKKINAEN
jgi:hypothetical protein